MNKKEYMELSPYSLAAEDKHRELTGILREMTKFHMEHCPEYARILQGIHFDVDQMQDYQQLPFLPVRLFKEYELRSVPSDEVVKTMTSSGTTGQQVSKIYLDKETSMEQTKILTRIVSDFIGNKRLPMVIVDSSGILKDRAMFSARGAGILGFSIFGRDKVYALDDKMELNLAPLTEFLDKHQGEKLLLFGFTFMIWQHLYQKCVEQDIHLDLSQAVLVHGGGWKKLKDQAVSPDVFKTSLKETFGISQVYNYYGMVEQTGSIYMECPCGHLHTSIFSDVVIRNPLDFSIQPMGERGLIEVLSMLPQSYPGHALLTEDEGRILGEDDCPCGRKGKYFEILGRIRNAEIRGCSDTYADKFTAR